MSHTTKNHHRKVNRKNKKPDMRKAGSGGVDLSLHLGDSTLQSPEEHKQDQKTDQSKTDKTEVNL